MSSNNNNNIDRSSSNGPATATKITPMKNDNNNNDKPAVSGDSPATKRQKTQGTVVVDKDEMVVDSATKTTTDADNAFENAAVMIDDDDDDDGVAEMMVASTTESRLMHLRQHCPEHPFVTLPQFKFAGPFIDCIPAWATRGAEDNAEMCDLCHCYVCNKPAKECQRWYSPEFSTAQHNHCHATNQGYNATRWNALREIYFDEDIDDEERDTIDEAAKDRAILASKDDYYKEPDYLPFELSFKPLAPDDKRALPFFDSHLIKCQACGWYCERQPVGYDVEDTVRHWCLQCGRVVSKESFRQDKHTPKTCKAYTPKITDVYLGSKTIPFRIKAHDPRKMKMFQPRWAKYEGSSPEWVYDEAQAEEDMFHQRFGTYPSLYMILASIPVVSEDKIPTDGHCLMWNISIDKENDDDDDDEDEDDDDSSQESDSSGEQKNASHRGRPQVRAEETDALLVDQNAIAIFQELNKFDTVGVPVKDQGGAAGLGGDIVATWNKEERRGEFTVRLFCKPDFTLEDLSSLLGAWFDILPFPLSDLVTTMQAQSHQLEFPYALPIPPFKPTLLNDTLVTAAGAAMKEAVDTFNQKVEQSQAKLSLKSSLPDLLRLGGVCSSDTTFPEVMRRYFAERLPEHLLVRSYVPMTSWMCRAAGITSYHRMMASSEDGGRLEFRKATFESYVRHEDIPLAYENLRHDCELLSNQLDSINTLLLHLENLGHDVAPFVEGLNVELLPFQRQTLQWALDREKMPDGVQSLLWTKLPLKDDKQSRDVYFNPMLRRIMTTKPKLVRGGIIADEMGLGKTVVSLALILQNPAPATPESGSKSEVLLSDTNSLPEGVGWDCGWKRELGTNPLRGTILSRGTLVVCHVSLVGQWIEEAERRLTDPGLVYSYHGQNRIRDAEVLAQNSIVVTTYATLAKDSTYHLRKAIKNGEYNYCAPCKQIRWWRIICDESHALKQDTEQTRAVLNLVGDHKWAVSGTPWNTSLMDIKNQLKFVGLEYVDKMFSTFQSTIMRHVDHHDHRDSASGDGTMFSHFLFLTRAVMIRHSQNQEYRGTSTTLMSLPPKTESAVMVEFKGSEATEYAALEKKALDFYQDFKDENRNNLSSHYLKLTQKLMPLRIACSGGQIPIIEDDDNSMDVDDDGLPKKKKKKKVQVFSDFMFQSKFAVLIEELKHIRDSEPDSKSLVFSQFVSSLKFLQDELPKHGFQFRTLSGDMTLKQRAEALHAFQHDPPTTIFLLSMRAGAVGINLTQANRVFLLEPAMNPSLEAQAIGRVHRLGQTRKVTIIRLLVKDSIETRICELVKKKFPHLQSSAKDGNDDDEEEVIHNAKAAPVAIVGSMRTEKASIMGVEFDFLFGEEHSLEAAESMILPPWTNEDDEQSNSEKNGDGPKTSNKAVNPESIKSGRI